MYSSLSLLYIYIYYVYIMYIYIYIHYQELPERGLHGLRGLRGQLGRRSATPSNPQTLKPLNPKPLNPKPLNPKPIDFGSILGGLRGVGGHRGLVDLHPVSITRFPLRRFSPGAGLLRNPFVHR